MRSSKAWWKANQSSPNAQNQHVSGVENHPNPGRYNYDAVINDGNFAKVNFTPGKLRRMLPRTRDYRFIYHEMLCALTFFMRTPKNWSVEFNSPPVVLNDGTVEHREDVRFKIGVEAVYSLIPMQCVPPGTQPHHYVNYYVS
eukprot:6491669-Amphidinium_carterae.2